MITSEKKSPKSAPREPLNDAQFAIVVLAVTSFTLIVFVLLITLWLS